MSLIVLSVIQGIVVLVLAVACINLWIVLSHTPNEKEMFNRGKVLIEAYHGR